MKKYLFLITLFVNTVFANCLFTIDGQSYQASIDANGIQIGTRYIDMHFERNKTLDNGMVEQHYISELAMHLTEEYLKIAAGSWGSEFVYLLDQLHNYAMELVEYGPKSDLFSTSYRLHGYRTSQEGITMVLCPRDEMGVMFAEILVSCQSL